MSRIRKRGGTLTCKQEDEDDCVCNITDILSDNTTLEPIVRVVFSKSGTSQVTNSHACTEKCAEEQCMCKPH